MLVPKCLEVNEIRKRIITHQKNNELICKIGYKFIDLLSFDKMWKNIKSI